MSKIYSITLKINKKGPTVDEYYDLLEQLYIKFGIIVEEMVFETDSKLNLHIHGIFDVETKFSFKCIAKVLKCHVWITNLDTNEKYFNWTKYLKKQKYKQQSILTLNPFYHSYQFTPL